MRILLTGASGQLAKDLYPLLVSAGHSVFGFDSKELDITDGEKVFSEVERISPECIVNSAAYTKVDLAEKERDRAFAVNRDGAANLAEAAKKADALMVHISTDFVFDGGKAAPYREEDRANPLCVYGESKLAGETEIIKRLPEHYIIRTSWLYGSWGPNFVKTILRLAKERDSMRVVYDQAGSPTWTVDLASAIVSVIGANANGDRNYGIYHYSNEGVASWYDFAEEIVEGARHSGLPVKCGTIEPILTLEYPTPARRPAYSVFDKKKIKKTFGIRIPHWRVSLLKLLNELSELNGGGYA